MRFAALALLAASVSIPAGAQKLSLDFEAISKKATEKTELSLEGPALEALKQTVLKQDVLKAAGVDPSLYASVNQVSVHSYEFAKAGDYSDSDLDALRKQVAGSAGWSRMLNVQEKGEATEIYVFTQADKLGGFLLIAAEPKELNVIHVSGSLQMAQLQELINSTIHFAGAAQE